MLDEEFNVRKILCNCEHFQLVVKHFTGNVFMVLVSYSYELNLKLQELHAKERQGDKCNCFNIMKRTFFSSSMTKVN